MTIAAGFVHDSGLLLCADSQMETWGHKEYDAKVGHFTYGNGRVGYAFAGSVQLAKAAIKKCERKAARANSRDYVLELIEDTLDAEYRRNVFGNPDAVNRQYQFILAVQDRSAGTSLYGTFETAISPVDRYDCIGIGEALAKQLLFPFYLISQQQQDVLRLAAYVLGVVKKRVPGCGGMSRFLNIGLDGEVSDIAMDLGAIHLEHHAATFDVSSKRVFLALVKAPDEFDKAFDQLLTDIRTMREDWIEILQKNSAVTPGEKT